MFADPISQAAARIIETAARRSIRIATVESCTGGLVAAALTSVAGSSAVFDRGYVTYANAAKHDLVGVPTDLIAAEGAVSEAVARRMARGAVSGQVSLAVSVTGVAGPGGGSITKPVGLVHLAAVGPRGETHQEHRFAPVGRESVRLASVEAALSMLLEQLS